MADTSNLTDFLQDVADAIKAKKEYSSSTKIPAANFDLEIANINTLKGEQITVTPLTNQQIITPSANKNAITQVTVNAVTSAIDSNITANNIKMGVNILGVEGNLEPDKPDQTKTVDPAITVQNITADTGYELSQVTINAVTSNIDANITAENIKSGVNILGVTGNYQGTVINNQDKSVNPSISQIVVGADSGYTGLGQVTVNAVTSNIDNNITAENIKSGVNILGVTGNYQGTVINNQDLNVTQNGTYTAGAGYTGLGTVNVSVDTIPEGIFIQENTPTKTTDEAFWLKDDTQSDVKINLNDLSDTVLNMSVTMSGVTKTVRDVINAMTTVQKNTFNGYGYHMIVVDSYNTNTKGIHIVGSANPFYIEAPYIKFQAGGTIRADFMSGGSISVNTYSDGNRFFAKVPADENNTIISDKRYTSGSIVVPNNASDYLSPETGLYITVGNKRYVTYKSGINLPFTKILDTTNATATSNLILNGYTAFVNNEKLTGTMNNLGALNYSPSISVQNIPAGYTTGGVINAVDSSIDTNITAENIKSGVTILNITGNYSGLDTSDANAIAGDIAYGKTAYVNNIKITGSLGAVIGSDINVNNIEVDNINSRLILNCDTALGPGIVKDTTRLTAHPLYSQISTAINLVPNMIANGETVLGVVGNYSGGSTEDLENVISEQENIIANLSNIVNSKAGVGFIVPDGLKFGFSTYNEFPNTWDFSQVQDASGMFASCYNLTNVPDMSHCNLQGFTSLMFKECVNLVNAPNLNLTNITEANEMFSGCAQLSNIPEYNTSNMSAMTSMFSACLNLITTPNLNTSNCNYIWGMFWGCSNLVNVLQYDTSNVNEQMGSMFGGCNNLSDASIQNIINMCLNSNITDSSAKTLVLDDWNSPFVQSNIVNTRYQNRWAELDAAGWTY